MKVVISEIAIAGIRRLEPQREEYHKSVYYAIKHHLTRIDVVFDSIPLESTRVEKLFFWPFARLRVVWQGTPEGRIVWSVKPLKGAVAPKKDR